MVAAVPELSRAQVLGYRLRVQGLDRATAERDDLALLDLGLQDTVATHTALVSLAARLPTDVTPSLDGLVSVWALRGSPHWHRPRDVPAMSDALWPVDDADAAARLGSARTRVAKLGGLASYALVADALREVVTAPTTRAEASAAVTAALPAPLSAPCRSCGSTHVAEDLFRNTALGAGLAIDDRAQPLHLTPLPTPRPARPPDGQGGDLGPVIAAYLRLCGPAGPSEVAKFVGTTAAAVKRCWPDGLVDVTVNGKPAVLPEAALDEAAGASAAGAGVRLLPPKDLWLQAQDRALVLPEAARRKLVWQVIGSPGVLLVDGEIAGTWRARRRGDVDEVEIAPFATQQARRRSDAEDEAARVARVRGADDVCVTWIPPR